MFEQILQLVKEHMGSNSQISSQVPADKQDEVNNEIATHVTNGIQNQASQGSGGLLSMLENSIGSGGTVTNAIEGGLVGSLASKFGLPAAATGAIAAALPGLLQKFVSKAKDPNDSSVSMSSIENAISGKAGGLGSLFNH